MAGDEAEIVSVDLPKGPFGEGYTVWRKPLYRSFAGEGQSIELIRASSHDSDTKARVSRSLNGKEIGLLFIDGDHRYEGVKRDFELYSAEVSDGGMIVFHDIANPKFGVQEFWREVKGEFKSEEVIEEEGSFGIGIIHKDSPR